MIQIVCNGNLGADAERKEINGKMYITFRMGVRTRKDTQWVSVLYRDSEKLMEYLKKGQSVIISGEPSFNTYVNKEGKINIDVSVFANTLDLAGSKGDTLTTAHTEDNNATQAKSVQNNLFNNQPEKDDLPF